MVDSSGSCYDLVQDIPDVTYLHFEGKNLSVKRNYGIRAAKGEFICHMDDDDFSAPGRVTDQVGRLLANPDKVLTGYKTAFWYDFIDRKASRYNGSIWGASMTYRRQYALNHPWNEERFLAEDGDFITPAHEKGQVIASDGGDLFVATLHANNLRRPIAGNDPWVWPAVGVDSLPEGFRKVAGIA
jgi:glycosyltransferase involved in cell wall biosynthesis